MKQSKTSDKGRTDNLALTPEAREQQLIAKAERLAEKKLDDGTASSQLIIHYLERDTAKKKLELKILEGQEKLITAKTEALQSAAKIEALYEEAMTMFRKYNGTEDGND